MTDKNGSTAKHQSTFSQSRNQATESLPTMVWQTLLIYYHIVKFHRHLCLSNRTTSASCMSIHDYSDPTGFCVFVYRSCIISTLLATLR